MTRTEPQQPDMDLQADVDYRVRLYRHSEPQPVVVYEGPARFTITNVKPIRAHGRTWKRWQISVNCLPGDVAVCGAPSVDLSYRPGGSTIEFGERHILYLLDREDPERPYGPDGPTVTEALRMAVETFAVQEGITDVRFE